MKLIKRVLLLRKGNKCVFRLLPGCQEYVAVLVSECEAGQDDVGIIIIITTVITVITSASGMVIRFHFLSKPISPQTFSTDFEFGCSRP